MAADQTAVQKAADEKAAAEVKAAEEQKAAEEKARQEAEAGQAEPKTRAATSKGHKVTGAAVVLRTKDKAERYLYRGAVVPDGVFTDESIKHALSVGLIEKVK